MKTKIKQYSGGILCLTAILFIASAHAGAKKPRIASIKSKPEGQTYGRWAVE